MSEPSNNATYPHIIETQPERTDLPLVVMPAVFEAMLEPFRRWASLLENVARLRMFTDYTLDEDEIIRRCEDADAIIVIGIHCSDRVLSTLGIHAKCFAFGGTGVASYINLDLAREMGVRVCNVVHYGDHAVAEHTMALLMELTRRVGRLDVQVRAGNWDGEDGFDLYGKKLAIIGLGGIGQTVARIANAYGMQVFAWSSNVPPEAFAACGATPVDDMRELIANADVVSVHMPLLEATRGIITAADLDAMRSGTLFINTARAEVIEPGALLKRLQRGDIPAALDVYEHEPLAADDPLCAIEGLVLTPHVAWRSDGAYANLTKQVIEAIVSFFQGGTYNAVV